MIMNLTPHAIVLPDRTIEPSGQVARCSEITIPVSMFDGVEIVVRRYGEVTGLPEPQDGVLYVVSMLVRMARPDRHDLVSPGDLIRDNAGKIIGCKNLVINEKEKAHEPITNQADPLN